MMTVPQRELLVRIGLRGIRDERANRLHELKNRPLWRKAYDAIVYVLTGREP